MIWVLLIIIICYAVFRYKRQRDIQSACMQIVEAVNNKDYTFRLSEKGYGNGELKKTLNLLVQKIGEERQDVEIQSWEQLTRILTHEIMNGMTPITSLSSAFMKRKDVIDSPIFDGIKAIHDTSMGLRDFVDSYRKFTSLQQPVPEVFSVREIIDGVKNLGIVPDEITLQVKYDLVDEYIYADRNLFRQVIINIVKNAVEARPKNIVVFAYRYADTPLRVSISNDGEPITEDVRQDIFVPFFSTKKSGSGIGLALSRQIMRLSGGTISLLRTGANGYPVTFLLEIP